MSVFCTVIGDKLEAVQILHGQTLSSLNNLAMATFPSMPIPIPIPFDLLNLLPSSLIWRLGGRFKIYQQLWLSWPNHGKIVPVSCMGVNMFMYDESTLMACCDSMPFCPVVFPPSCQDCAEHFAAGIA
jgi:hypothetical protein